MCCAWGFASDSRLASKYRAAALVPVCNDNLGEIDYLLLEGYCNCYRLYVA